jgi:hypothetical protein
MAARRNSKSGFNAFKTPMVLIAGPNALQTVVNALYCST